MLQPRIFVNHDGEVFNIEQVPIENTGLKDKNGTDIHTGDIVEYIYKHKDVGTLRGLIIKNDKGFYFIELYVINNRMDEVCKKIDKMLCSKIKYEKPNVRIWLNVITKDGCIVIGNIYENKELLENEVE
jgi:hypothetical protein|nr:MAG TPA: YopX protein [Caudoviricetes sp.]